MSDLKDAERLQMRMQRIRRRMGTDVEDLITDAQQLMDWKYYISRHPIACSIAAMVAGYLVVPTGRSPAETKVFLDPEVSRDFMEKNNEVHLVDNSTPEVAKKGVAFSLGAMALNFAVRTGMNYATQYLKSTLAKEFSSSSSSSGTQSPSSVNR